MSEDIKLYQATNQEKILVAFCNTCTSTSVRQRLFISDKFPVNEIINVTACFQGRFVETAASVVSKLSLEISNANEYKELMSPVANFWHLPCCQCTVT